MSTLLIIYRPSSNDILENNSTKSTEATLSLRMRNRDLFDHTILENVIHFLRCKDLQLISTHHSELEKFDLRCSQLGIRFHAKRKCLLGISMFVVVKYKLIPQSEVIQFCNRQCSVASAAINLTYHASSTFIRLYNAIEVSVFWLVHVNTRWVHRVTDSTRPTT